MRRLRATQAMPGTRVVRAHAIRAPPTVRIPSASKTSRARPPPPQAGLVPSPFLISPAALPPRWPPPAPAATRATHSTATRTRRHPRRRADARAVRCKGSVRIPRSRSIPTTHASRPTIAARPGPPHALSQTGRAAAPAASLLKSRRFPNPPAPVRAPQGSRRQDSQGPSGRTPGVGALLAGRSPRGAARRSTFARTSRRRRSVPLFASGRTRIRIAPPQRDIRSSTSTTRASSTRAAARWGAAAAALPRA
jgi:hypothetical protein